MEAFFHDVDTPESAIRIKSKTRGKANMLDSNSTYQPTLTTPFARNFIFGSPSRSRQLFSGNVEPPLDKVLSDPLTHLLMASDGVQMTTLILLIDEVQRRFR